MFIHFGHDCEETIKRHEESYKDAHRRIKELHDQLCALQISYQSMQDELARKDAKISILDQEIMLLKDENKHKALKVVENTLKDQTKDRKEKKA